MVLKTQFLLKFIELCVMILNTSYILGMLWLISCEAYQDYYLDVDFYKIRKESGQYPENLKNNFLVVYDIPNREVSDSMIIATYFLFTTLSTVGFGDYHPENDFERCIIVTVFLFGVAIFSYILGEFLNIVTTIYYLNKEYDEGIDLNKFFGTLKKFNRMIHLEDEFIDNFENFFEYKWSDDRNLAFQTHADLKIFHQMPIEVQTNIYRQFLFKDVIHIFRHYFDLKRFDIDEKNAFYNWENDFYRDFVIEILKSLSPRLEPRGTVIFSSEDSNKDGLNEVLLIWEGKYKIVDFVKPESTIDKKAKSYCIALRAFKPH